MGFLKTLLVIILVIYLIRWILIKTFPYLLKKLIKNMTTNVYEQQRTENRNYQSPNSDGKVTINLNNEAKKSKIDLDEGEYVDFEEVK
jgi:hypothetical protein